MSLAVGAVSAKIVKKESDRLHTLSQYIAERRLTSSSATSLLLNTTRRLPITFRYKISVSTLTDVK
jgi:hypothetical protein